mmetsp:Transcript_8058/g.17167  ORF Transcript_8058/g.17167 Transcript_8058/m.17167 type:complete len:269 (-) Transcript_8058:776-1582(-)
MRNESIIRAERHGQSLLDHFPCGMIPNISFEFRHGLQIGTEADLEAYPHGAEVSREVFDVFFFGSFGHGPAGTRLGPPSPPLPFSDDVPSKEMQAVSYPLGVQIGDGGEYAFGSVGLSGVDGFVEEGLMGEGECLFVVGGGVAGFGSGDVHGDYGEDVVAMMMLMLAMLMMVRMIFVICTVFVVSIVIGTAMVAIAPALPPQVIHRRDQGDAGQAEDPMGIFSLVNIPKGAVVRPEGGQEEPHGAGDDSVVVGRGVGVVGVHFFGEFS